MDERGPVVDEARVATFERDLGSKLPDDYRAFILAVNGGSPSDQNAEFTGARTIIVHALNAIDAPDDAWKLVPKPEFAADFPSPDMLEIGYDPFGDRILLVVRGARRGEVWYQLLSDPRPEGSNPRVLWHDRRDMKRLAGSFTEFIGGLRPRST